MALSFRMIWALFISLFRAKIPSHGPLTRVFTVLPFLDCETGVTLNAARYFVLADIVQNECNLRSGFIGSGIRNGMWAVALGNTIYHRRAIKRFSRVRVTVELIGWDNKFFVWQNTFQNYRLETCAVSFTKVAVRSKQGVVSVEECFRMMGVEAYVRPLRRDVDELFLRLEEVAKATFTASAPNGAKS
jgi:hypothetical protein